MWDQVQFADWRRTEKKIARDKKKREYKKCLKCGITSSCNETKTPFSVSITKWKSNGMIEVQAETADYNFIWPSEGVMREGLIRLEFMTSCCQSSRLITELKLGLTCLEFECTNRVEWWWI